jgi:hypothetical protein
LHIPIFRTAREELDGYRSILARTPPPAHILKELWKQRSSELISDADFLHGLDEALSYQRVVGKLLIVVDYPSPPLTWPEIKGIIKHQLHTSSPPLQLVVINYLTFASARLRSICGSSTPCP